MTSLEHQLDEIYVDTDYTVLEKTQDEGMTDINTQTHSSGDQNMKYYNCKYEDVNYEYYSPSLSQAANEAYKTIISENEKLEGKELTLSITEYINENDYTTYECVVWHNTSQDNLDLDTKHNSGDVIKNMRYFRCEYKDKVLGYYSGMTTNQAADQAFNDIIKNNEHLKDQTVVFNMIEHQIDDNQTRFSCTGQFFEKQSNIDDSITKSDTNDFTRYFKYEYDGVISGRYSGTTPENAANKCLCHILKHIENKKELIEIKFNTIECTDGCEPQTFSWIGQKTHPDDSFELKSKEAEYILDDIPAITSVEVFNKDYINKKYFVNMIPCKRNIIDIIMKYIEMNYGYENKSKALDIFEKRKSKDDFDDCLFIDKKDENTFIVRKKETILIETGWIMSNKQPTYKFSKIMKYVLLTFE